MKAYAVFLAFTSLFASEFQDVTLPSSETKPNSNLNVRSEFLYLKPETIHSGKGYFSPAFRVGINSSKTSGWDIDFEGGYSQYDWYHSDTSLSFIRTDITFYDITGLSGYAFKFGGFSIKPALGINCTYTDEEILLHENSPATYKYHHHQVIVSPALGVYLGQNLFDPLTLSAEIIGTGSYSRLGLGIDANFKFKSEKSMTLGIGVEGQGRFRTFGKADANHMIIAHGGTLSAAFNF